MGKTAFVNVEIKAPFQKGSDPDGTDGVEKAAADCILEAGMEKRVIVSSFNPLTLRRFRTILPGVPIAFLYATDVPFDTPALMTGIPHEAYHPQYKLATAEALAREHGGRQGRQRLDLERSEGSGKARCRGGLTASSPTIRTSSSRPSAAET